mgnify:CR=1 FL=1
MTDKQINELLEESHICVHCGGETKTASDYNEDTDEDQEYTYCTECGFEDK